MKKLAYFYPNSNSSKELEKTCLYEGERIISKCEDIKFEDDIGNKEYEAKSYFTNFRILLFGTKIIYDVPLNFLKSHYVKKPLLYGSNYIYVEFSTCDPKSSLPTYIRENIASSEIAATTYQLPKYLMLKFRGKDSSIDQAYNILKLMLNSKEWNNSYVKKQNDHEHQNKSTVTEVSGLGMERTKNLIMTQMKENKDAISGSFTDIQSLRANAQQMIDIAQGLRTKLGSNLKNDPTMNQIDQVLFSIGFVDPVTKETAGKDYYLDLAKQISSYFIEYFSKNKIGILSLIDAYCYYNRARGANTISPKDMKDALDNFNGISTNIHVKVCKNEMILLHTEEFSVENLFDRLRKVFTADKECVNLKDFTEISSLKNQLLSKILIEEMIDQGLLASDESELELSYYENKILNYKI